MRGPAQLRDTSLNATRGRLRAAIIHVALLATVACLCGTASAAAMSSKPAISRFKAAPAQVVSGGSIVVSATVSNATECTLSSNETVVGLPVSFACESGAGERLQIERQQTAPADTGRTAVKLKLVLTASGPGGKAVAKTTIAVAPGPIQLSAGSESTCALLSSGHVECWGHNQDGQLGDGNETDSDTPAVVKSVGTAVQVAAGTDHTCALLASGSVECWGSATWGEIGKTSQVDADKPISVVGAGKAAQLTAGFAHTCALLPAGHIECWGRNNDGQLGNGTTSEEQRTPVEVQGVTDATQLSAGGNHTCALLSGGHVDCWGENKYGQLGDGTTSETQSTPVEVRGITDATQLSAGYFYTCALLSSGQVDCWGEGFAGGETDVPLEVKGVSDATQVGTGYFHACAVLSSGHVDCWGWNEFGQLGDGTAAKGPEAPVEVQGVGDATQTTAGYGHTCALLSSDRVDCWGENMYGQLGDGTETGSDIPVEALDL